MNTNSIRPFLLPALLIPLATILSTSLQPVNDWLATHWALTYDLGFIKRGLTGSVFQGVISSDIISIEGITIAAYVIYFVLAGLLATYIVSAFRQDTFLATLLVCSGFALQQLGQDIGRFDQIVLILTLLSIIAIPKLSTTLIIVVTTTTALLSLLIHEGSALISIPVVFSALTIYCITYQKSLSIPIIYIVISMAIFFSIIIAGNAATIEQTQWFSYLQEKTSFNINMVSAGVPFTQLQSNVEYSLERLLTIKTGKRMALLLLFCTPYLIILYALIKTHSQGRPTSIRLLLLLPLLSTTPLYFLGVDYFRWVAIAMLNTLLIVVFFRHISHAPAINLGIKSKIVLAITALYTGPLGITVALPDRALLLKTVVDLVN